MSDNLKTCLSTLFNSPGEESNLLDTLASVPVGVSPALTNAGRPLA